MEQIITTSVETADGARSLCAALEHAAPAGGLAGWEPAAQRVFRAIFRGDAAGVRKAWPELAAALATEPLLYVALAKGGRPQRIVASRNVQRVLRRLLVYLPRLGLLHETFCLIRTIHDMERNHAVGPGAVTEFDQMFAIGCRGIIRALAVASENWFPRRGNDPGGNPAENELVEFVERAMEALLQCWLEHSRRVRLSVLEGVADDAQWQSLRKFIEQYGADLFTQKFMNLGNLRGILHQGVDAYLQSLLDDPDAEPQLHLLSDLGRGVPRDQAVEWLGVAMEAVVENYTEYLDYNSTTTQSDRGEMLYTLLDFLRLAASYNRIAWNLRPVVLAHEVLVRQQRGAAAERWRRAIRRAHGRHRRGTSRAFRAAYAAVRHATAQHRRAARRTLRPPADHRPAPRPGRSGHRRGPRGGEAPGLRRASEGDRRLDALFGGRGL